MNVHGTLFEAEHTTRREVKARETRARLIDTSLELFARHGYDTTSVKEIAQAAGVAQGLLYNYFPSKEDLFWAILERYSFVSRLREMLMDAEERPAGEVLREAGLRFHEFLTEREPLMRLILSGAQTNSKVAEIFARYLREEAGAFHEYLQARIAMGELRPHDTQVTLRMLMSPIVLLHVLGPPAPDGATGIIGGIVETLLRGLQPMTAQKSDEKNDVTKMKNVPIGKAEATHGG